MTMSKAFANTKLFGAAAILFAAATIFNASMNASVTPAGIKGEPVLKVGPTFPPSPWDDDAPSVTASR